MGQGGPQGAAAGALTGNPLLFARVGEPLREAPEKLKKQTEPCSVCLRLWPAAGPQGLCFLGAMC